MPSFLSRSFVASILISCSPEYGSDAKMVLRRSENPETQQFIEKDNNLTAQSSENSRKFQLLREKLEQPHEQPLEPPESVEKPPETLENDAGAGVQEEVERESREGWFGGLRKKWVNSALREQLHYPKLWSTSAFGRALEIPLRNFYGRQAQGLATGTGFSCFWTFTGEQWDSPPLLTFYPMDNGSIYLVNWTGTIDHTLANGTNVTDWAAPCFYEDSTTGKISTRQCRSDTGDCLPPNFAQYLWPPLTLLGIIWGLDILNVVFFGLR